MANYNPKIDLVFRKLFGSEENKDLLLSLINGIIYSRPHLTDLTIKNPYNLAEYIGSKTSILDVKAVDQDGVWYDIEMQIGELGFYGKRAMYYLSKMYVDQLEEGDGFDALRKTIGIHLIDFDYFHDSRYRRHFVFKDMETNDYIEHLSYQQLYFVEMRKFRKDWSELATSLDRWIAFLNKAQTLSQGAIPASLLEEPQIVRAVQKLETMGFDRQERTIYEGELKARLTDQEELRTAMQKGLDEGLQEGLQQGIEQGIEQGLHEALRRLMASGITEAEARRILGIG